MRLIDADELKTILSIRRTIETIQHAIDTAPTIDAVPATIEGALGYLHKVGWMQEHDRIMTEDAVPVVRCKDCRHWTEWGSRTGTCERHDSVMWYGTDSTDYCSFAERSE